VFVVVASRKYAMPSRTRSSSERTWLSCGPANDVVQRRRVGSGRSVNSTAFLPTITADSAPTAESAAGRGRRARDTNRPHTGRHDRYDATISWRGGALPD